MKPYLNFLYALTGIAFSAASFAAPAPQAANCRIQLGGGAVVDYGKIKRNLRAPRPRRCRRNNATSPSAATSRRRSRCANPAAMAAPVLASSRLGVTPQASQGLGLAAGRNLGAFVLRWRRDTATLDGSPARLIVSSDGGATWRELDADAAPDANDLIAWTRDAQRRRPAAARSPSACGSRRPSRRPPRCTWAARSSSTVP